MNRSDVWKGEPALPDYYKNLAGMLAHNRTEFGPRPVLRQIVNNQWWSLSWERFTRDISSIQQALKSMGFSSGDKLAILSANRWEMLEMELAVMSMGGVAVPIFAGYPADKADTLLTFCEASFVAVADQKQFDKIAQPDQLTRIITFDQVESEKGSLVQFQTLLENSKAELSGAEIARETVCLMMYTSGTMGLPKCVQLTHGNILSQQAAMRVLWQLTDKDRFLSYLPWHHSFGGIYEKYAALFNGALLALEDGHGKNIDRLIENWKAIKPTVFFSVPRVFQEIATQVRQDPAIEKLIFHDELRCIFTAAAPLPKNISDMFQQRSIPVYEGWGLTETSPCCTVTDPEVDRLPGVVGKPIPGVSLKISAEGEILVRGPNVMVGYFKNDKATKEAFTDDGWFCTGDVGEFTDSGLRLITRKDRIFKLSNAEKVIPTEIENLIVRDCPYLSHAFVSGSGRDYPVVLLFPNRKMFAAVAGNEVGREDCDCPDGMPDFAKCLKRCMNQMNDSISEKYARVGAAMLVDHDLSIENEELTPSMKLAPNVMARVFKANIEQLYSDEEPTDDKVYLIELEQ